MRILSCHIENFGKLQNLDLTFPDGITVMCRENGWGKSTLAAFLQCMFYGLAGDRKKSLEENERRRYAPWQGGVFGGSLTFCVEDRCYRVTRTFGEKESKDVFLLRDEATKLPSRDYSSNLGQELFGLDRESFLRTIFIRQNQCSTASTGDIQGKLGAITRDATAMAGYEKAVANLNGAIASMNPNRATGSIAKRRSQILQLEHAVDSNAGIGDSLAAMENKLELEKRHHEELVMQQRKLQALQQQVAAQQQRVARREEWALRRKELAESQQEVRELAGRFPEEVPSTEVLDGLLGMVSPMERALERYYNYRLPDEEAVELEQAKRRYANEESEAVDSADATLPKRGSFLMGLLIGLCMVVLGFYLMVKGISATGGPSILRLTADLVVMAMGILLTLLSLRSLRRQVNAGEEDPEERYQRKLDRARYLQLLNREGVSRKAHAEYENYLKQLRDTLAVYRLPVKEPVQKYLLSLRNLADDYEDALRLMKRRETALECFSEDGEIPEARAMSELPSLAEVNLSLQELLGDLEICQGNLLNYNQALESLRQEYDEREENLQALQELRRIQAEQEKKYRLMVKARDGLVKAHDEMTARYADPIRRSFRRYYELVTGEPGDAYEVDARGEITVREAGLHRGLEVLSSGCQDLAGICMRLALVDAMYPGEKPLLILDDPFVNLDDDRMEEAVRLLKEIGLDYQILYFTCSNSRKLW